MAINDIDLERLSREGVTADPSRFADDSLARALAEAVRRVNEIGREHAKDRRQWDKDGRFTKEGRAAFRAELAQNNANKLRKFEDDLESHHRPTLETLRRQMKVSRLPADASSMVALAPWYSILLSVTEGKDKELSKVLAQAVAEGDSITFQLYDVAPAWLLKKIDPLGEMEATYRDEWADKKNPEGRRLVKSAEALLAQLESVLAGVRRTIERDMPANDPIRELAEAGA